MTLRQATWSGPDDGSDGSDLPPANAGTEVALTVQLRDALESRNTIGQALGMLMERQQVTTEQAFDILRRASQRENRKLREIASELVDQHNARVGTV